MKIVLKIFVSILIVSVLIIDTIIAKEKGYFEVHEKGWHWYREVPGADKNQVTPNPNNKTEADKETLPQNPIEELKGYQKRLEEAKAMAVMHPNKENIEKYQYLQYEALERANKFSNIWMENVYRNPELNYSLISPTSQKARHVYLHEKEKKKMEKIEELSKEYGLFYFFKKGCEYCKEFGPIVKRFSEKYKWSVLAISEFGEEEELFDRNVRDNGLAERWGVSTYPSLFAVNPNTGDVIPIANGMISIEEMEERIMLITRENEENNANDI